MQGEKPESHESRTFSLREKSSTKRDVTRKLKINPAASGKAVDPRKNLNQVRKYSQHFEVFFLYQEKSQQL